MSQHEAQTIPPGKIDMHSHLLPGIDDGCPDLEDSLACIPQLIDHGYVGTVCTPHFWPQAYPHINVENVQEWTAAFKRELADRGITYRLWSGGELRLAPGMIDWLATYGVPTLGDSRCVLMDMWEPQWHKCIDRTADWLMEQGYQPILAHPERSAKSTDLKSRFFKKLDALTRRGVLLQGNLRTITGGSGATAAILFRQFMQQNKYAALALDMHSATVLPDRLLGLKLVAEEFGQDAVESLAVRAPRQLVLGED